MHSGIYLIRNLITNLCYIGKTKGSILKRIMQHLDGKSPNCREIYEAVKEYGKENFEYEILCEGVIPELLSDLEKQYIREYNTQYPHGYNCNEGGEGAKYLYEDTIKKMSESAKNRSTPHPMLNKKHTKESKEKMSESHKGKKLPKETTQKISVTMSKIRTDPLFYSFRDYFLSLPDHMPISEKRKIMRDKFKNVIDTQKVWRWTKKLLPPDLDPELRKIYHPAYYNAKEFYFSLPEDMYLTEKRKRLFQKFPDVKKFTIRDWIRKWSNDSTPKGTPRRKEEYTEVHNAFLFLPQEMNLMSKRKHLYDKFPLIPKTLIYQWVQKWQPIPDTLKKSVRRKKAYEFFLSLPNNLSLKEKKIFYKTSLKTLLFAQLNAGRIAGNPNKKEPPNESYPQYQRQGQAFCPKRRNGESIGNLPSRRRTRSDLLSSNTHILCVRC